jgi:hypothetical protein
VPVLPTFVRLPDRDTESTAPPRMACALRVQWRLTCTGLWSERRTCPRRWWGLFGPSQVECARLADADDVPLLGEPEDTCCHRCDHQPGNEPHEGVPDRPRPMFFRQPAKADGTRWVGVPSTVATRDESRVGLSLTPPAKLPALASAGTKRIFSGHCKCRCWASPGSDFERAGHLLNRAGALSRIRAWA